MRNILDVKIRIDDIICYEEGDGSGNAEPYLWPCFYKIDGTTCHVGANGKLSGHAVIERRDGTQGNLYISDVSGGDTVPVPAFCGSWQTRLIPIPIDPAWLPVVKKEKGWDDIPGVVGVLFVLMEEDNLPDSAALAGYSNLCSTFETELNKAINNLGIFNPKITPEVEQAITDAVAASVKQAITNNLNAIELIWQWLAGPDDTLGSGSFHADHDDLVSAGTIPFSKRWKNGVNVGDLKSFVIDGPGRFITSGGEWELRGHAHATEIILHTYEVTCVRSATTKGKHFRIGHLGVRDESGVASMLTKGDVMYRIRQGDRFFVRDTAGRTSWVAIHEPLPTESSRYRFLTTTADGLPTNNLSELPHCS